MNQLLNMGKFLLDASNVAKDVNEILNVWVGPLFTAIGGVGCIYIIILAIQYIRAESDSKRAEAKTRIVNCVIGVLTLIVLGVVCLSVDFAGIAQWFGYVGHDWQVPQA